jgi:hypothetical protein
MKRYLANEPEYRQLPRGVRKDEGRLSADGDPSGYGDPHKPSTPDVPAGYYAVTADLMGYDGNDLYFYGVDRPEDGPWRGRVFVKSVVGGHPRRNVDRKQSRKALEAILKTGVEEARTKYGIEIGRCWKCNRELTDETSRALGIGPVCRNS